MQQKQKVKISKNNYVLNHFTDDSRVFTDHYQRSEFEIYFCDNFLSHFYHYNYHNTIYSFKGNFIPFKLGVSIFFIPLTLIYILILKSFNKNSLTFSELNFFLSTE